MQLRSRKSTSYYVSKGKERVVAAIENIRKRKHLVELKNNLPLVEHSLAFASSWGPLLIHFGVNVKRLGCRHYRNMMRRLSRRCLTYTRLKTM